MKRLGLLIPILLTFLLTFSIIGNVNAPTIQIQPAIVDAYIAHDQTVPAPGGPQDASNFGAEKVLCVGHAPAPYAFRSLVKFDLSSIPSGSTINSATLYLYFDFSMSFGFPSLETYIAYPVTKDWLEPEVSWDNAKTGIPWGSEGGDFDMTRSASATGGNSGGDEWFGWDVTNIVSYWITEGNPNYGFLIKEPTDDFPPAIFHSSEWTDDTETLPYLVIEYTVPVERPVGGVVIPVNKLEILTPYLALAAAVVIVSALVVQKKRRD